MVWLAVFCLAAIGCFTMIRSIVRPGAAAAPAPASLVSDDIDTPVAKGDRLPSRLETDVLRQAGFDALKRSAAPIAVPEPAAPIAVPELKAAADNVVTVTPRAAPAADEVVSWHWREGSKVVRRRNKTN